VRRANYRGRQVVFPLGVLLLAAGGVGLILGPTRWLVFLCGVGALGLIDDLVDGRPRGWRGHGRALASGKVSTGAIKAIGTTLLAAYAAADLIQVLTLVLAAHLGNLLDTRPGRAEKAFTITALTICASFWSLAPLAPIAPLVVAVAICSWLTLRERAMLGDAGASMIGGMIGVLLVTSVDAPSSYIVLSGLSMLAIYGEFRSLGSVVERVPLLQRLDSLGRAS
jgi:UDP-GlcNAc:undecaprenyl-phosphate GlcNAc-1-phosphate transferase